MAEKNKATSKLKARLPRGLADRGPAEIAATRRMLETIRQVYERYGFEPVETPAIEYTDALGKFLPDQDRPNEGVFSFKDDDEQWLSLRYDLTAPLARYVAENFDALPKPYRSYRFGWVFRNEKPGPGRFRQFMQFDADTVGSASPAADAEMCMMAADTMEALGIPRGSYVVKVNNRKVLDGVLESIGLGGEANAQKRLTVLRAIDKLDRLGVPGVRELLGPGRQDESGDFTRGAGLQLVQIDFILNILLGAFEAWTSTQLFETSFRKLRAPIEDMETKRHNQIDLFYNNAQVVTSMGNSFDDSSIGRRGVEELSGIFEIAEASGYGSRRIRIDPSVVRGLEYYTGPVFEVDLTFPITGDDGKPVRFGSVGAGGRYDGLISRFRREAVPATGFSIGVSRLAAALAHLGKIESKPKPGPVVVTVLDKERITDYQRMVKMLRDAGITAELYLGSSGFSAQMKYADKRNSPCIVIQGSDEKNHPKGPKITVKDLIVGAELAKFEGDRKEYLKKQKESQKIVAESRLLRTVQEVLVRHHFERGDKQVASNKKRRSSQLTQAPKRKAKAERKKRINRRHGARQAGKGPRRTPAKASANLRR